MEEDGSARTRKRDLHGIHALIATTLCILAVLLGAFYALDGARILGFALFKEQYLAPFFGLTMAAGFLLRSGRASGTPQTSVPWYDYLAAGLSIVTGVFPAMRWEWILMVSFQKPVELVILGTVALALLFEAIRRYAGWPLLLIGGAFIAYAFVAPFMPGAFYASPVAYDRLAVYLYSDVNALFGVPIAIVIGVVLSFVLFGQFLFSTGGGQFFTDVSQSLMGRSHGGQAKVAVLASALFGSISGSAVANVVSTGTITIPLMKKSGYTSVQAGAIEATASSGGQLMPPIMGATAFLLAEFLAIPYADVALAAALPIGLYYLCILIQVHLIARRDNIGAGDAERKPVLQVVQENGIYALPLVAIVYALFGLNYQPEKAAFIGIAATLLVHAVKTRGLRMDFVGIIASAGAAVVEIALICAFAGIIIGVLNVTGLSFSISLLLLEVGDSSLLLLLVLGALMSILLGMGMPTTGVYLLLAVLIGPALIKLGVEPLAAHLFILYFGVMSQITPPICFAAIAAASIAGASGMRTGWAAVRLAIMAYVVPFAFVYNPGLILIGDWWTILANAVLISIAVFVLAAAVTGYARLALNWLRRGVLAGAAAILLFNLTPTGAISFAMIALAIAAATAAAFAGAGAAGTNTPRPQEV